MSLSCCALRQLCGEVGLGVNTFHQLGAYHAVDAPGVTALGPTILLVRAARDLRAHPR